MHLAEFYGSAALCCGFFFGQWGRGRAATLSPRLNLHEPRRPQVEITAAVRKAEPRVPTPASGGARGGSASQPLSSDFSTWDYDYVQELIKVAPPALARLLSFEHLRYGW